MRLGIRKVNIFSRSVNVGHNQMLSISSSNHRKPNQQKHAPAQLLREVSLVGLRMKTDPRFLRCFSFLSPDRDHHERMNLQLVEQVPRPPDSGIRLEQFLSVDLTLFRDLCVSRSVDTRAHCAVNGRRQLARVISPSSLVVLLLVIFRELVSPTYYTSHHRSTEVVRQIAAINHFDGGLTSCEL